MVSINLHPPLIKRKFLHLKCPLYGEYTMDSAPFCVDYNTPDIAGRPTAFEDFVCHRPRLEQTRTRYEHLRNIAWTRTAVLASPI